MACHIHTIIGHIHAFCAQAGALFVARWRAQGKAQSATGTQHPVPGQAGVRRQLPQGASDPARRAAEALKKNGRHLLVSGINPDVERVLRRSGAWAVLGPENIFPAEANLTMSTKRALQRAKRLLAADGATSKADVRIFYDRNRLDAQGGGGTAGAATEHVSDYEI